MSERMKQALGNILQKSKWARYRPSSDQYFILIVIIIREKLLKNKINENNVEIEIEFIEKEYSYFL